MSNYKKFNISKPKKYTGRDGVERTYWSNIGTMTEFQKQDGSVSRIMEIPAISLEANIFPAKPREDQGGQSTQAQNKAPQATQAREEEVVEYSEDDGSNF